MTKTLVIVVVCTMSESTCRVLFIDCDIKETMFVFVYIIVLITCTITVTVIKECMVYRMPVPLVHSIYLYSELWYTYFIVKKLKVLSRALICTIL